MKIKITFILLFFSTLLITAQQRYYPLDTTFGNNGVAMLNLNVFETHITHQVVQPDGKIMVAGYYIPAYTVPLNKFIIRFNADGTLDNTFGTNGQVAIPTTETTSLELKIHLFPNGAFLINTLGKEIQKFNADGSLDTSFGNAGSFLEGKYCDIAIQNDNKIVITYSYNMFFSSQYTRFLVQRYEANGLLDTTFVTNSDYGVANKRNWGKLLIQPDGRIIVIHIIDYHYLNGGVTDYTLFRLNPDGSNDLSAISPPETHSTYSFSALQDDGKLVLNGYFYGTGRKVRRFNADLTMDTSYGDATGYSPVYPINTSAETVKLGVDNIIFTVQEVYNPNTVSYYWKLYQYASDGNTYGVQQLPNVFGEKMVINLDIAGDAIFLSGHQYLDGGWGYRNNAIYIVKLKADGTLGEEQHDAGKTVSFFPNPVVDLITFNENIQSASVYAFDGKLMDCRLSDNKMDVANLVGGVYIIKGISNDGVSFTEKIIKL